MTSMCLCRSNEESRRLLEKRHITQSPATFELVVGEKPATAGIDPLKKLIDRNPDDNVKKIGGA